MPEENVKVAVRVRPFNKRERARNAELIVQMNGAETKITDPTGDDEPKKFAFDYSYWSFDGSKDRGDGFYGADSSHKNGKKFCDQKRVFDDLGVGVLNNLWEGYNSTLFAYGQTGSGKSWSVVGYGINAGIVPQFCQRMFEDIDGKAAGGTETKFEVYFSMLEIYNEEVRDLLSKSRPRGGLKVRENPKKGFYAQALSKVMVVSYKDIEAKMAAGTANRTVAATAMNATSSRAHTVVTIALNQTYKNAAGADTTKHAESNLVDLAGSERQSNTGATGNRLKEGAAINLSLSSLGNVIAALADQSNGQKVRVPYRDSVLTKLLKNALGGNSKTIMIAAVSPADINYPESLSTLRYADRAKQIKTKCIVNEDPTEKLIRELQDENERLMELLKSGGIQIPDDDGEHGISKVAGMSKSDEAAMRKQLEEEFQASLEENEKAMAEMKKSYEEKLKASQDGDDGEADEISAAAEKKKTTAHLTNLNMDPTLTGHITHFLGGNKVIGNKKSTPDIALFGPSIVSNHAVIAEEDGKFFITQGNEEARIIVSGNLIEPNEKVELLQHDRITLGTTQLYVFVDPKGDKKVPFPSYDDYEEDSSMAEGVVASSAADHPVGKEVARVKGDLTDVGPAVEEANAISQAMDEKMEFEPVIVPGELLGDSDSGTKEVLIRAHNLETDQEWFWSSEKFFDRKDVMSGLFARFDDDDDPFDGILPEFGGAAIFDKFMGFQLENPFIDEKKADVDLGAVKIAMGALTHCVDMEEKLPVINFKSQPMGTVDVALVPMDAAGKEYFGDDDDLFVEEPEDMIGKPLRFKVKVTGMSDLPQKYHDIYFKYTFYDQPQEVSKTAAVNGQWKYEKEYNITSVDAKLLKYLSSKMMHLQIVAKHDEPKTKVKVNTKEAAKKKQKQARSKGSSGFDFGFLDYLNPAYYITDSKAKVEKKLGKKEKKRVKWVNALIAEAKKKKKHKVSVTLLQSVLMAKNQNKAKKAIEMVGKYKGGDHSDSDSDIEDKISAVCSVL